MYLERFADAVSDLMSGGLWLIVALIMTAGVFSDAPFGPAVVVYAGVAAATGVASFRRLRRAVMKGDPD